MPGRHTLSSVAVDPVPRTMANRAEPGWPRSWTSASTTTPDACSPSAKAHTDSASDAWSKRWNTSIR